VNLELFPVDGELPWLKLVGVKRAMGDWFRCPSSCHNILETIQLGPKGFKMKSGPSWLDIIHS